MIRCTCCQTELTAPQFYNGFPYGYACIKKIDPAYKRTKTVYVACDSFKVQSMGSRHQVRVLVDGKAYSFITYGDSMEGQTTSTMMQDGILFVAETALKGK